MHEQDILPADVRERILGNLFSDHKYAGQPVVGTPLSQPSSLVNWWKTAAVDASQIAPAPGPGADAAMAAGPPMMDPAQAAAMGMAPPQAGAPPADPAAAGGAPPADPAAAAAAGAPPMDPAAMGPPPTVEQMAAQGDPMAVFFLELKSQISNIEVALRGLLKASGAQVSADALLDDKKPNITLPSPEAASSGSGGSSDSGKKTAGVVGTKLIQAAGMAGVDADDVAEGTDLTIMDNTPDDDEVASVAQPPRNPMLPKAAKAPVETVAPLGARASIPGANGAEKTPTGLTSMDERNSSMIRMLRVRKSERALGTGQYSANKGNKYRS